MRVAITGGIAEGKSTVLAMLAEAGFSTTSADAVAREVFTRPDVQASLAGLLGVPGPVDRAELRAAMAAPHVRAQVNALTHPRIRAEIEERAADFDEIPLLIEACLFGRYDEVWLVTCGLEEQQRRLIERYGEEGAQRALDQAQLPTRAKMPFAHAIIRTNRPLGDVRSNVLEILAAR